MKFIKDPIYGYIVLDEDICRNLIDTAAFQRLRRVVQTSYAALYPSAFHNRFVHSIGVYHLGCLAASHLTSYLSDSNHSDYPKIEESWKTYAGTFKIACLLHDIGHAPFSHSGEIYYEVREGSLTDLLVDALHIDDDRKTRLKEHAKLHKAANHEIMSALLGIETFRDYFETNGIDEELFARCITGYQYDEPQSLEEQLQNILISLLNSTTIDVDKLDYLIRDAYVVGFESTSIDYERLLRSLRIHFESEDHAELVYHKSAVSVLENVVFARDFERKWVQVHPAILYDQFLIQHAIPAVANTFEDEEAHELFSKEALTVDGRSVGGQHVSLLCDDDIIYVMKNRLLVGEDSDPLVMEFFDRKRRQHPVWKSEAEFHYLFDENRELGEAAGVLAKTLKRLQGMERLRHREALKLDETALESVESSIRDSGTRTVSGEADRAQEEFQNSAKRDYLKYAKLLQGLRDFCETHQIEFDFTVILSKAFESGFGGKDYKGLKIAFEDDSKQPVPFVKVTSSGLASVAAAEDEQVPFYLFHHKASDPRFPRKELLEFFKESYRQWRL